MIIYAAYFSEAGHALLERLEGHSFASVYDAPVCGRRAENLLLRLRGERGMDEWLGEAFKGGSPVLFVGAAGIAVRALAPFVRGKEHDSPVVVMDEAGRYVIPLLSGHLGGANELAVRLASVIGAQAVVTTATDVRGLFAVDVFARRNGLRIGDVRKIRNVSAKILRGEPVTMAVRDVCVCGGPPAGVELISWQEYAQTGQADVIVSPAPCGSAPDAVVLTPKTLVLGAGCRKGKSYIEIEQALLDAEQSGCFAREDVLAIASVSAKEHEPGLDELAQRLRVPFVVFDAPELAAAEGTFASSEFVAQTVGVDNVCERAAIAACGGCGELIMPKRASNGVTLAAARKRPEVSFKI